MKDQLSELLGGEYGEICEIWLDGAWDKGVEDWHLPELYDHINLHSAAFQLAAQIAMKVSTFSTFCSILKARSYTTKHGEVSRKNSLVLDSISISVSSTFQAQISGSFRPYTKNCFNSC